MRLRVAGFATSAVLLLGLAACTNPQPSAAAAPPPAAPVPVGTGLGTTVGSGAGNVTAGFHNTPSSPTYHP